MGGAEGKPLRQGQVLEKVQQRHGVPAAGYRAEHHTAGRWQHMVVPAEGPGPLHGGKHLLGFHFLILSPVLPSPGQIPPADPQGKANGGGSPQRRRRQPLRPVLPDRAHCGPPIGQSGQKDQGSQLPHRGPVPALRPEHPPQKKPCSRCPQQKPCPCSHAFFSWSSASCFSSHFR